MSWKWLVHYSLLLLPSHGCGIEFYWDALQEGIKDKYSVTLFCFDLTLQRIYSSSSTFPSFRKTSQRPLTQTHSHITFRSKTMNQSPAGKTWTYVSWAYAPNRRSISELGLWCYRSCSVSFMFRPLFSRRCPSADIVLAGTVQSIPETESLLFSDCPVSVHNHLGILKQNSLFLPHLSPPLSPPPPLPFTH